jgi:hypothetical protein
MLRAADGYCGGCTQDLIREKKRAEDALRELLETDIPPQPPGRRSAAIAEARAILEGK